VRSTNWFADGATCADVARQVTAALLAGVLLVGVLPAVISAADPCDAKRKDVTMVDKESLARRVEPLGSYVAHIVRSPKSEIEQMSTPFFSYGAVYRIAYFGASRPVGLAIGCAEPDFTVLLPGNPAGFTELAQRAGVRLDTPELRVGYVVVLLETTRDFSRRFQVLRSVADIELIPRPTPEEEQRYRELLDTYRPVIRPPALSNDWEVTVFALVVQDLVRITVKLGPGGAAQRADTVLEKDLPIAVAL
jgi:hypothetical protein